YSTYSVKPQLGTVKEVYCLTPTVKGNIEVTIKSEDKSFRMSVSSPPKTMALINVPKASYMKKLYTNGVLIWSGGKPMTKVPGILYKGEDKDYIQFSAEPGSWHFSTMPSLKTLRP
ncbi:MAG TPA: alpha-L-rhamnosidase C-terminal domain-containing protein, partial [Chondromyces sp.]|nr:alpha-L-rhamnosidase C-terminal domain-containing protein [Chondromyces sp.]